MISEREVRLLTGGDSERTESESPSNGDSFEANTKRPVFAGQEKYRTLKMLLEILLRFFFFFV